jgi:transposase
VPKGKPPYPKEFRDEALRLYRSSGRSLREVSEDLAISVESLRSWVKQTDVDAGKTEGVTSDEREELRRLRKEVRVLKEEREILKKAAAWFAKETGSTP